MERPIDIYCGTARQPTLSQRCPILVVRVKATFRTLASFSESKEHLRCIILRMQHRENWFSGAVTLARVWNLTLLCAPCGVVLVSKCAFAAEERIPSVAAVPTPAQFNAIKSEIRTRVAKGEFPSFAIGVIQGNTVFWAETLGWADREAHVAATPETAYGLASLGKSITATAMMTLVEQGKVGLDATVAKIIQPDRLTIYEGRTDRPTLRQLLNMTAGIPHGALTYTAPETATQITEAQVLRNRALVVFPPGQGGRAASASLGLRSRRQKQSTKWITNLNGFGKRFATLQN